MVKSSKRKIPEGLKMYHVNFGFSMNWGEGGRELTQG